MNKSDGVYKEQDTVIFVLEKKIYVVELNCIVDYWQISLIYSDGNLYWLQFLWKALRNKKERK